MALVWQCDRCNKTSMDGDVDDPPDEWAHRTLPVRGSEGARSSMDAVVCAECDDDLYRWFHEAPHNGERSAVSAPDQPKENDQ